MLEDYGFSTLEEVIACIPGIKRKRQKSTKKSVYIYDDKERVRFSKTRFVRMQELVQIVRTRLLTKGTKYATLFTLFVHDARVGPNSTCLLIEGT